MGVLICCGQGFVVLWRPIQCTWMVTDFIGAIFRNFEILNLIVFNKGVQKYWLVSGTMAVWPLYLSFCLLFALDASESTPLQGTCDAICDNEWSAYGCRCFRFFNLLYSWIDAEKMCLSHGGNLASVHTYEEYIFTQNLIQTKNLASTEAWIGGYDAISEGTWLWSDGSKVNIELWAPDQPDNYNNEHCLGMNYGTSGNWNDYTCDWKMAFVCVKK